MYSKENISIVSTAFTKQCEKCKDKYAQKNMQSLKRSSYKKEGSFQCGSWGMNRNPMRLQAKEVSYVHKVKWSCSVACDSWQPHGPQPTRLLGPWKFPGKSTGVGWHFLLQGIFLTWGSNPGLPPCRETLYPLSHKGSPIQMHKSQGGLRWRNLEVGQERSIREGFIELCIPRSAFLFLFILNMYLFIYLTVLGLHCCTWVFSTCDRGYSLTMVHGL